MAPNRPAVRKNTEYMDDKVYTSNTNERVIPFIAEYATNKTDATLADNFFIPAEIAITRPSSRIINIQKKFVAILINV